MNQSTHQNLSLVEVPEDDETRNMLILYRVPKQSNTFVKNKWKWKFIYLDIIGNTMHKYKS